VGRCRRPVPVAGKQFGIGGAFWGLVVGAAVLALDRARDKRAAKPAEAS